MTKKLALILTLCFITALVPGVPALAESPAEEPYYIIDEEFASVRQKDSLILPGNPSGWTLETEGGEFSGGYNSWFKVDDWSDLHPVKMCKWFRAENNGSFTLELRFNFTANIMENNTWRVRQGEKSALSFIIKNGNLCVETIGVRMPLAKVEVNKEVGLRADFDLPNRKISAVYVNGVLKAEDIPFRDNVASIDNFEVATGVKAKGTMYITPIKLYKNFVVNEKLISMVEGNFPSDWALDSAGGTARVTKILSTTPPDFFSLKIDDTSSSKAVSMTKAVPPQSGPLTYEYKMMFEDKADGVSAAIYSGGTKVFEILTQNGGFAYNAAGGSAVTVPGYESYLTSLWYAYRVDFDTVTKRATLWINGRKAVTDIALPSGTGPVDSLAFSTGVGSTGVIWLDDITLCPDPPLPPDYVPVPVNNAAQDDYLVGMLNCSLWREGHHGGWDPISGWPERKPILGFYDEGSTEVADWQTKFLVENGIDFQLTSWFRPNGGKDTMAPVKDPYTAAYALHQGYFYSEYSHMLKYAIYWENGGNPSWAKGSEDFRKNYVPFWIEYYFKDPRYLIVDNKPVIAILTYSGLQNNFGTPEQIKAEMDYLRAECVKAGFDGAYILSMCPNPSVEEMELRKNSGIDALFYYAHNFDNLSADAQAYRMTVRQNIGVLDIIGTISANQNYTAWGHTLFRGGNMEPDEFERLASWLKDEYMPREKGIGKKVALLGIWNEYGEGSYLMPCPGLYGFGYLDAFRRAFLPGAVANNIGPSEASIVRMNRLYSEPGRVIPPIPDPRPDVAATTVKHGWYFETAGDREGWNRVGSLSGFTATGGKLVATANGLDCGVVSRDNLGIDITNVPYVRLRHKNTIPTPEGEVYFTTTTDTAFDEAKCVRYSTAKEVNGQSETIIYMGFNQHWTGTLKRLRIDPFNNAPGERFEFDSIELLEYIPEPTPTPTPTPTPAPMPEPGLYERPGHNAFPNFDFEYDFAVGTAAKSSGASYTFGTWPGKGLVSYGNINNTQAIMLDVNNMTRDQGGDYVEVKVKEGFSYQPGKKYGVYFWAYAPVQPYVNPENPDNSGGVAINLKWNDLYFGNNRYHKSTQVNATALSDFNGWVIKADIIDMNNLGGYVVQQSDIRGEPTVKLCYNGGPTSSAPGERVFAYDNIYITELAGDPRIWQVRPVVENGKVTAIDVELEYMIDWRLFTGEDITVTGEGGIAWVLGSELLNDNMTIRVNLAEPLQNGDYTVTLGDDVKDLWNRTFADNKTAQFTIDVEQPLPDYEVGAFGLFAGASEITGGTLPAGTLVRARAQNIKNNTGRETKVNLIVALYKNGMLENLEIVSVNVGAGGTAPLLETELNTPALLDGDYTLKAFLWEGFSVLKPIQKLSISN